MSTELVLVPAARHCLKAGIAFFITGLASGVWKYKQMMQSSTGRASHYVDIAHRSSLMYSNAAVLLGICAQFSVYPTEVNEAAAIAANTFFALAIASYVVHGIQNDTTNQIQQAKTKPHAAVPLWLLKTFMAALIVCELGGSVVLGAGAMQAL
ncbi:hypothetical protein DIPPA_22196 [Diplonema papillatum]|nr:hypothetical protein DIPPA_22196 [Diplonema papillatum]|eukprot:gene34-62_t